MDELKLLVLGIILTVTVYTEWSVGKVYNWMTIPALSLGFFLALLEGWSSFKIAFAAAVIGGGIFFLPYVISSISRGRPVIGGGDVKLAAAIGALSHIQFVLATIWWGILVGGLMGIGCIMWRVFNSRKSSPKERPSIFLIRVPFGIALSCGAIIALGLQEF